MPADCDSRAFWQFGVDPMIEDPSTDKFSPRTLVPPYILIRPSEPSASKCIISLRAHRNNSERLTAWYVILLRENRLYGCAAPFTGSLVTHVGTMTVPSDENESLPLRFSSSICYSDLYQHALASIEHASTLSSCCAPYQAN